MFFLFIVYIIGTFLLHSANIDNITFGKEVAKKKMLRLTEKARHSTITPASVFLAPCIPLKPMCVLIHVSKLLPENNYWLKLACMYSQSSN